MSSYFKHMYEFEKFKLILLVSIVGVIILVIGGALWWFFIAAPTWNTFAANFVDFFAGLGADFYGSFADMQTYFINHWSDLVALIICFGSIALIIYALAKIRKPKKRIPVMVAGVILLVFSSLIIIGSLSVRAGYIENPTGDTPQTNPGLTYHYVTVNFDGYFRGGWWGDDSVLEGGATITENTALGEISSIGWQLISHIWTVENDQPTALVRVFFTITYADGTKQAETELFRGTYRASSDFNWVYRINCPNGKDPTSFVLKVTMLDYDIFGHHGYTTRYQLTQDLA